MTASSRLRIALALTLLGLAPVRPAAAQAAGGDAWTVDPARFEHSMSLVVALDGVPVRADDRLAAFVGDEVRGLVTPTAVGGGWLFFLTVYADGEGEDLAFRARDAAGDTVHVFHETRTFRSNAVEGSPATPLRLTPRTATSVDAVGAIGADLRLANYPNPFRESTRIVYELPEAADVELAVYDLLGRRQALLVAGRQPAGPHAVVFGDALPPGAYLYRLRAGDHVRTHLLTRLP